MPGIVPAFELDPLGQFRVLALRARGVRIASVGADETVHHQLERRRDLIPVHGRNDHDAVSGNPHGIDLVHPVLGLTERMIWITRAWPVTKLRCRRKARLTLVYTATVFRGESV